ncbi:hypothetical protein FA13DRAFT_1730141 [Coprinellus micaceus]|uniref:Uncharacterized protein n=1 Tax=Coprinellus micaceus TaxID=71717 RepID=A0A4Y7TI64_COPMI|nr:hypothetical protein FA13DRAFT_1730141 [Coprinellus micaceus]
MGCIWSIFQRNDPGHASLRDDDREPQRLHFAISNANLGPNYGSFNQNTFFQGHSQDTSPIVSPAVEQRGVEEALFQTGTFCNVPENYLAAPPGSRQDQSNADVAYGIPLPPSPVSTGARDPKGDKFTDGNDEDVKDAQKEEYIRNDSRNHTDTDIAMPEIRSSSTDVAQSQSPGIPRVQDDGDAHAEGDREDPFITSQNEGTELGDDAVPAENHQVVSTSNPEPKVKRPPSSKTLSSPASPQPTAPPSDENKSPPTRADRETAFRDFIRALEGSGDGKKLKREVKRIVDDAETASRKLSQHAFRARSYLDVD